MTRDGGRWLLVFWRCRGSGLIVVWTRWVAMPVKVVPWPVVMRVGCCGLRDCNDGGGGLRA